MYRLYKNDQPKTTYIGLLVTFETDVHVFNHHFSTAFKMFSSETCQTCDESITEDADGVCYVVRLHQLNAERTCTVMTDGNKISRPFMQLLFNDL
jgi:hypothetical protein